MKKRMGFTLLELIIVIIVIGILVAMALPQFNKVAEQGRIARAQGNVDMIRKAQGIYFAYNSQYEQVTPSETFASSLLYNLLPEVKIVDNDKEFDYVTSGYNNNAYFAVQASRTGGSAYDGSTILFNSSTGQWLAYTP